MFLIAVKSQYKKLSSEIEKSYSPSQKLQQFLPTNFRILETVLCVEVFY